MNQEEWQVLFGLVVVVMLATLLTKSLMTNRTDPQRYPKFASPEEYRTGSEPVTLPSKHLTFRIYFCS